MTITQSTTTTMQDTTTTNDNATMQPTTSTNAICMWYHFTRSNDKAFQGMSP